MRATATQLFFALHPVYTLRVPPSLDELLHYARPERQDQERYGRCCNKVKASVAVMKLSNQCTNQPVCFTRVRNAATPLTQR
jgi:hypothetical protein